jgi:hypothetical protein
VELHECCLRVELFQVFLVLDRNRVALVLRQLFVFLLEPETWLYKDPVSQKLIIKFKPFDHFTADLLLVHFSTPRVSQDGPEGGATHTLGHVNHVGERIFSWPIGRVARQGADHIRATP